MRERRTYGSVRSDSFLSSSQNKILKKEEEYIYERKWKSFTRQIINIKIFDINLESKYIILTGKGNKRRCVPIM